VAPISQSLLLYDIPSEQEDSETQLLSGLLALEKSISPKYFYDEQGSRLFTDITRQPEYYPTRTELALLQENTGEIIELVGKDRLLIEYGSGSSEKIRILLESLRPKVYVPIDISRAYLTKAADALNKEYPWLEIRATCLDYTREFELPFEIATPPIAFFPGSSIGNFSRDEALQFLKRVRHLLGDDGGLLIGVDLKKDIRILNAAYNDANGVTGKFNLNILRHLNREFSGNFNLDNFFHLAEYDARQGCIQMFLKSKCEQLVNLAGHEIFLGEGETIHTENSHKYSLAEFQEMADNAGFTQHKVWCDARQWFAVFYLF
jgi:L-histidine Nalpha-methyltransferase